MSRDEWVCAVCGARYVIRPLARDCEKRHEREGEA